MVISLLPLYIFSFFLFLFAGGLGIVIVILAHAVFGALYNKLYVKFLLDHDFKVVQSGVDLQRAANILGLELPVMENKVD